MNAPGADATNKLLANLKMVRIWVTLQYPIENATKNTNWTLNNEYIWEFRSRNYFMVATESRAPEQCEVAKQCRIRMFSTEYQWLNLTSAIIWMLSSLEIVFVFCVPDADQTRSECRIFTSICNLNRRTKLNSNQCGISFPQFCHRFVVIFQIYEE